MPRACVRDHRKLLWCRFAPVAGRPCGMRTWCANIVPGLPVCRPGAGAVAETKGPRRQVEPPRGRPAGCGHKWSKGRWSPASMGLVSGGAGAVAGQQRLRGLCACREPRCREQQRLHGVHRLCCDSVRSALQVALHTDGGRVAPVTARRGGRSVVGAEADAPERMLVFIVGFSSVFGFYWQSGTKTLFGGHTLTGSGECDAHG